jgi:pyruvate formate lyase activating enzyme
VDYVALDVKTSLEKYRLLGAKDTKDLQHSVEMLKSGKVDYEFRTTVVPNFVEAEDVLAMGEIIKGAKAFALQQFVPDDTLDKSLRTVKPYSPEKISELAEKLKDYAEKLVIRI